jgi:hypothetical protein
MPLMPKKRGPLPESLRLYRVFPWKEHAREGEAGHALYVRTPQGSGRVDNPERYLVVYLSDAPTGAIAEAFGNHAVWSEQLLQGPPSFPNSVRALGTYTAEGRILDLDDPQSLVERELRPSAIVTRDRARTQRWALAIFQERRWSGVRWWSYYKPEWGSYGMWGHDELDPVEVTPLAERLDLVQQAASEVVRVWEP